MSTVTALANGSVEDKVLDNAESTGRDIRNHMLFEVSTEAANRGDSVPLAANLPS